jgi:hypothetical protein
MAEYAIPLRRGPCRVHADDRRMTQLPEDPTLLPETLQAAGGGGGSGTLQYLHRDTPVEIPVAGPADPAHAALAGLGEVGEAVPFLQAGQEPCLSRRRGSRSARRRGPAGAISAPRSPRSVPPSSCRGRCRRRGREEPPVHELVVLPDREGRRAPGHQGLPGSRATRCPMRSSTTIWPGCPASCATVPPCVPCAAPGRPACRPAHPIRRGRSRECQYSSSARSSRRVRTLVRTVNSTEATTMPRVPQPTAALEM